MDPQVAIEGGACFSLSEGCISKLDPFETKKSVRGEGEDENWAG